MTKLPDAPIRDIISNNSRPWVDWFRTLKDAVNLNIQSLEVNDITDPVELATVYGKKAGDLLIVYQDITGENKATIYKWDTETTLTANSPFVVEGNAGYWLAIAGQYTNNWIYTRYGVVVGDGKTEGDWRIYKDGNDFRFDVYTSGAWVNKGGFKLTY